MATISRIARNVGACAIAMMALAGAQKAEAAVMLTGPFPQAATVDLAGTISGANLTATANLSILSASASQMVISISLTNTTPIATSGTNRLVSFGFDVTPDANRTITSAASGNADWGTSLDANISGGTRVDICAWDGNNCTGGGNQGVGETLTESFTLTINGSFGTGLSLDNFVARYQSIGTASVSGLIFEGTPGGGTTPVPEPMSLALFGLGLAGLGALARHQRKDGHGA